MEKRTAKKGDDQKAVRKMVSMKRESWEKADRMADAAGSTRSGIIAKAIDCLCELNEKGDKTCG